ncbi:Murein L,D-transpeptidase YcbB/YkuD [Bradyrhizobium lablabi]|uniref:Murein L,D-transpeptidase YcbB/YkuD n=1 Tax=Bradyrhizobium lablabi TaxID=722472 RepID=A0A1M6QMF7_9BRAD|nr:L,D-transpeptidase family protein [Bradyrhizobium lablabi]SHK21280.1 Murein L,D-transpeptidase YcbB/YkuD [Bradyrhizobium lablabi]
MRDCLLKNRGGFDRVLMTIAATFLTVSATSALATSALAQADPVRNSAAELAIDAAVPRPEPANVPPPTINDFKMDTTASVPDPAKNDAPKADAPKAAEKAPETKPSDVVTAPATDTNAPKNDATKNDATKSDTATTTPAAAPPAAATATPAPEPAKEPTKAASNVPPADQPVADKLREMLAAKSLRYFDRKAERTAVEKFYTAREFAPLWTQAGSLTESGKGVLARLKDAASEGLNAADYPVPDFAGATNPDALAEADLKLTASMLDYARHAQSGRMHWSQVSGDISYPEHPTDPIEVLTNVTTAKDASAALDGYNPPQKLYKELKAKLAELRGQGDGPVIQIADGPALKFTPARGKKLPEAMMEDPRVPQLRAKLGISENADDTHYDAKVAEAVRKFQEGAELKPTGILDDKTVRAINSPKRDKQIDIVIVNMERWRWLPRQLGAPSIGNAYVILNIPDYTLKVMQNGGPVWTTKVVTGQPGIHATPLLTETMKFITVNPTWNVPPSIIYNEYLPALQQDPTVLQRMGLKLDRAADGSIHISQPPGEANALGRIRFNFPNKFLVYQHDTPDKNLFAKEERAFSHGCMRVQNPDIYAATLLNITAPNEHYTPEKIHSMYGHSEIDIKFPTPIPVNITYQTAFVDDAGKLQFRRDVYGRDATMLALLKNTRSKDLENVVAHSQPSYSHPVGNLPAGVNFASDNSFSSGPSFFERLFGPPTPPAPIPGRRGQPQQRRLYYTR